MNEITKKELCTGCSACMNICPKNAISMEKDKEGFYYPKINQDKCIDCGACKRVCPILNTRKNIVLNNCYAGYNKRNDSLINKSSSGAIFEIFADYILNQNGIVVGAAFDNKKQLKHIAITSHNEINKLKGSKYIQSDLTNIFKFIRDNIKNKKILFVGTPCQVAGLKSYIKDDLNNLICIDLICHGVPSQNLFDKYILELEKKYKDVVIDYDFRNKITGWQNYSNTIIFKSKKISQLKSKNSYMKLFLSDVGLRRSCYKCNFKFGNKYSDLTLGDYWGVKKYHPKIYNEKGVSIIIINSALGNNIFQNINNQIVYEQTDINYIKKTNYSLFSSSVYTSKRENFYRDLEQMSFSDLIKKYSKKQNIVKKIIKKIVVGGLR